MTCAGNNTIAALLAGGVEAARLEDHLDRCQTCRELVARLGRGLSAIGEPVTSLPQVGAQIGRYEIRRVVGVGGMGVVYEARDTTLDRRVAVKLLRPELHDASLLAEAQAMARLQHANIVSVFDVGVAAGQLYICMELVDGTTLRAWTQGRSWREIVDVYRDAGEGLAYVHRANLVHLDFKPDNVLVDRDGRARVTDFGLARMLDAPVRMFGGTPAYMPPEQRRGEPTDARSDQYAFCASLAEALAGRGPAAVKRAIARGMAVDRADRFTSMRELLAALAPRRRRYGALAVIAAAAATALVLPGHPTSRTRIIERPTTKIVDWSVAMPVPVPVEVERPGAAPRDRIDLAAPATPTSRSDFAPAFAMLARATSRAPSAMQLQPRAMPSSSSDVTELDLDGFDLGLCDDGEPRICSQEAPECPPETIAAVQLGCWTCADVETCAPLGICENPAACTVHVLLANAAKPPPPPVDKPAPRPPPRPKPAGGSGGSGGGAGSGSGSGTGSGTGSGGGSGSGSGSSWGSAGQV